MTTPPNYRRVECCGNCKKCYVAFEWELWCKNEGIEVLQDHTCDDYDPEDGE